MEDAPSRRALPALKLVFLKLPSQQSSTWLRMSQLSLFPR